MNTKTQNDVIKQTLAYNIGLNFKTPSMTVTYYVLMNR